MTLFRNRVCAEVIAKSKIYLGRSMTGSLSLRRKREIWAPQRHRRLREDGGRDWSDVSTSRGAPRVAGSRPELGETQEADPLSSRNNQLCWHFDFRLLASWTMGECMSVVLSRPVCGKLLWQPQEMSTDEVSSTHRIWTQADSRTRTRPLRYVASNSWASHDIFNITFG